MACRTYISGYGNGYFGTNAWVKRGQYTRMVDGPFKWKFPKTPPNPPTYTDIAGTTFQLYIEQVTYKGAISGYADCSYYPCFKPENYISRAEMARMVVNAAGWNDNPRADNTFQDVPTTHWAYSYIESLARHGAIAGSVSCGPNKPCFRPGDNATRGEIAQTLFVASNGPSGGMLGHCCMYNEPLPYHTPIPGGVANGQWDGTNNMYYNFTGDHHFVDAIIPGGYLKGASLGSNAYRADATDLYWTTNYDWLNDPAHEYPNGQGNEHYVPAVVFHASNHPNESQCSAGHYDNIFYSDMPGMSGYMKQACAFGSNSEARLYPTSVSQFHAGRTYYVAVIWNQDTGSQQHQIGLDSYYLNIGTGNTSPVRRDFQNKFCFDDNSQQTGWCANP